jgi:hypothetical protein
LVNALRPQTPKHIRSGWSHTDTSKPVEGPGSKYGHCPEFRTSDLSITGPTRLPTALTGLAYRERHRQRERERENHFLASSNKHC